MNEIRILRITSGTSNCFSCGERATQIIGLDYDVCDNPECMEYAFEKKDEDLDYLYSRRDQIMAQSMYENRLNK